MLVEQLERISWVLLQVVAFFTAVTVGGFGWFAWRDARKEVEQLRANLYTYHQMVSPCEGTNIGKFETLNKTLMCAQRSDGVTTWLPLSTSTSRRCLPEPE